MCVCHNESWVTFGPQFTRSVGGDETHAEVLIMSLHRCVYLLARAHLQRRACGITCNSAAAAVLNSTGHVCVPEGAVLSCSSTRRSASSDSSWRPPDTSLFVPLAVKSDGAVDGAVGAELTRPLDKSNVELV